MNAKNHTADSQPESPLALTRALIERSSITPDDAGCQTLMSNLLTPIGFDMESMRFGDTDNFWARRGSDGPVLCFAGHTDVVPPGNLDAWDTDPFKATEKDGLLYGRGAADMKASLAAMVIAAQRFVGKNPNHKGSLAFLITSDEEGKAHDGTRKVMDALNQRKEKIDWCVVGEPSSHKQLGDLVRIGRRGSFSGMLRVHGVQGHVAYPDLADNPISRFAPVLKHLCDKRWDEGNEFFPPTSFQVVRIEAGAGAPNVIPGELFVRFNFRYCTEWHHSELASKVTEILDSHELNYSIEWHVSGEPFLTEKGALVKAVSQAINDELGVTPELSTGGGTSDGRFIAPSGAQVVELGPINATIHKVNECVKVSDIELLTRTYERIMQRLLS